VGQMVSIEHARERSRAYGFPEIASQEELDNARRAEIDAAFKAHMRAQRVRSLIGWVGVAGLVAAQVALVVTVASGHPGWPF